MPTVHVLCGKTETVTLESFLRGQREGWMMASRWKFWNVLKKPHNTSIILCHVLIMKWVKNNNNNDSISLINTWSEYVFLFLQGTVQISIQCVYQTLVSEQSWSKVFQPFFLAFFFELLTPPSQKVFSEKQQAINDARYFFKPGGQLTHHISISKETANQATTWSVKKKKT